MPDFFARCDTPHPDAFPLLGAGHVCLLLTAAALLVLALTLTRRASPRTRRRMICTAAVLVPVLELSHSVWMYLTGTTRLIQLLPLHLCGLQSLLIPLSVFTRATVFRDLVYATSVLGGLFGTLLPAGVAGYYPLWSFQTLQTVALHSLLIYVPLAQILAGAHRPDLRRFPRALCLFLGIALTVGAVDLIYGQNYMFLCAPPEGTPLVWVFHTFGPLVYLLVTFVVLCSLSITVHLPFCRRTPAPCRARSHS